MEYVTRKRLSALGITQNLADLDCITAEALMCVDMEYAAYEADEAKKASLRSKGRR